MKSSIKVWKGRAYLHQEYSKQGLSCAKDTPLGSNPELIKKVKDRLNCDVVFLNDDFSEESL